MLTHAQYALLNKQIQNHRGCIDGQGLEAFCSSDMAEFKAARSKFPGYVHPALDPDLHTLTAESAFWIGVRDPGRDRRLVALIASRRYDGALYDLLMTRAVWGVAGPTIEDTPPFSLSSPEDVLMIAGRLSLQGGMIIDEGYQGRGLSTSLMWLVRLSSFRAWREDYQFGLLTEVTHLKGIHIPKYGYEASVPCFDTPVRQGPRHDKEYLVYVGQPRILATLGGPTVKFGTWTSIADTSMSPAGSTSLRNIAPSSVSEDAQAMSA